MSTAVSIERGAQIATEALNSQHLSPAYYLRADTAPVVSNRCVHDLLAANKLKSLGRGLVDGDQVEEIFRRTRVIDGTGLSILRVSIKPPEPSGPCDPLPSGRKREQIGWDFDNESDLGWNDRWAGIAGVWPLSEESLRRAMRLEAYFMPSMKGFVDGVLIKRVSGYYLDLTSGSSKRRWVQTRNLEGNERDYVLPQENGREPRWDHAWVNVPQGVTATLTEQA